MLQQQARGEITTSMMTAMMWLRSWSNWKTGNVEHSSAGGIRTATGRAFSVRTFQSAMKKLEQMGWITRHTVKGSHQDYGVTLHNYKYVDEDGKVLILNPKPLTIAPKKSRARKTRALRKTAEQRPAVCSTSYPIIVVSGKFAYGGKVYDARAAAVPKIEPWMIRPSQSGISSLRPN
jgi:hypothetical protein